MKVKSILIIAFVVMSGLTQAQNVIEVNVKNIRGEKGNIRVGLFNNEKDFLQKAIQGKVVKVSGNEVQVVFENLPAGDYAVSVVHDENDNGEMDTNFMGIPKEGFAFGNNAMGTFGPPSFDKAKVNLKGEPVRQTIRMKYM